MQNLRYDLHVAKCSTMQCDSVCVSCMMLFTPSIHNQAHAPNKMYGAILCCVWLFVCFLVFKTILQLLQLFGSMILNCFALLKLHECFHMTFHQHGGE